MYIPQEIWLHLTWMIPKQLWAREVLDSTLIVGWEKILNDQCASVPRLWAALILLILMFMGGGRTQNMIPCCRFAFWEPTWERKMCSPLRSSLLNPSLTTFQWAEIEEYLESDRLLIILKITGRGWQQGNHSNGSQGPGGGLGDGDGLELEARSWLSRPVFFANFPPAERATVGQRIKSTVRSMAGLFTILEWANIWDTFKIHS